MPYRQQWHFSVWVARLFRDNVWKLHRLLEEVISDWEPNLCQTSCIASATLETRIQLLLPIICHDGWPDGVVNQEVKQFLWLSWINPKWLGWMAVYSQVCLQWPGPCLDGILHFMLNTGQHPQLSVELLMDPLPGTWMTLPPEWKSPDEACSALTWAAETWPNSMHAIVERHWLYEIGDKVWLKCQNITNDLTNKETGSQMAQSIPSLKSHLAKCIPPQTTLVIRANSPSLLGNTIEAL